MARETVEITKDKSNRTILSEKGNKDEFLSQADQYDLCNLSPPSLLKQGLQGLDKEQFIFLSIFRYHTIAYLPQNRIKWRSICSDAVAAAGAAVIFQLLFLSRSPSLFAHRLGPSGSKYWESSSKRNDKPENDLPAWMMVPAS